MSAWPARGVREGRLPWPAVRESTQGWYLQGSALESYEGVREIVEGWLRCVCNLKKDHHNGSGQVKKMKQILADLCCKHQKQCFNKLLKKLLKSNF